MGTNCKQRTDAVARACDDIVYVYFDDGGYFRIPGSLLDHQIDR